MRIHSSLVKAEREVLPLVPLRDMVVFPHMMAPFIVGREHSVKALEKSLATTEKLIFLVAQKDPKLDNPEREDMHDLGVLARVIQNLKLPNGNVKVMVEGVRRGRVVELLEEDGAPMVEVETYSSDYPADEKVEAYMSKVLGVFEQYAKVSHHLAFESLVTAIKLDDPDRFCDQLAAHLLVGTQEKQSLLELLNPYERLQRLHDLLDVEVEKVNIDKRINVNVKKQMEKAQKEYYLNEKVKAIHQELGRKDDRGDEIAELREKIEKANLPKEAAEKADQELKRLEAMPPVSAEATVSRNYIDWLVRVPWKKKSRELKDLDRAQEILDEDHYGLEEIKERILEFLAVRQMSSESQSSVICFVGPPGVGKSSFAKSIARAMGREFVRFSLGGVRDEAEIRGHRRTYIGAFPGQIIQMMKRAGTVNPVFLLDEIDKMSTDFRGDPSAALLEVLDPEQNDAFLDHYLDVDYDLSKVMFIATANVSHTIPPPLRDRMEVINLTGYTLNEKMNIARQFLVPKQAKKHGLGKKRIAFEEEALRVIAENYTREAGVRDLERQIAKVCRKVTRELLQSKNESKKQDKEERTDSVAEGAAESQSPDSTAPDSKAADSKAAESKGAESKAADPKAKPKKRKIAIEPETVAKYLGKIRYRARKKNEESEVGVAMGLAWTETGGDILEIEVGMMPGKGKLTLTGKLGEVMQESARAGLSYLRSRVDVLGVDPEFHENQDLHVHVPEGAIPKDGPSAGITMATALISATTGVAVRKDIAMTGEITLRGKVLPVGGVKHKLLAAFRAGITEIVLPSENEKDLEEIPDEIRDVMEFHLVESMDEVLTLAMDGDFELVPPAGSKFKKATAPPPGESGPVAN